MQNKEVRKFYENEANAGEYDDLRFSTAGGRLIDAKDRERLIKLLDPLPRSTKILDVAAGTGRATLVAAEMGFDVTSFDNSEAMLSELQRKAEEKGLKIKCVVGDATKLPFSENEFDVVTSLRFLWHFKDYQPFMKEMLRVSKPSGFVFADFLNKKSLRLPVELIASMIVYSSLSNPSAIKNDLDKLGADMVQMDWDFFYPYFFYRKSPGFIVKMMDGIDKFVNNSGLKSFSSVYYATIKKRS